MQDKEPRADPTILMDSISTNSLGDRLECSLSSDAYLLNNIFCFLTGESRSEAIVEALIDSWYCFPAETVHYVGLRRSNRSLN